MEEQSRSQSDFNMSISFLNQINMSLTLCLEHRRQLNLDDLFMELMNLYIQLSTEISGDSKAIIDKYFELGKKEKKKIEKEFETAEQMINEIEIIRGKKRNNIITHNLYKKLMAFEIFLRKIIKDSGLLLKIKEDARYSMMN